MSYSGDLLKICGLDFIACNYFIPSEMLTTNPVVESPLYITEIFLRNFFFLPGASHIISYFSAFSAVTTTLKLQILFNSTYNTKCTMSSYLHVAIYILTHVQLRYKH